MKTLGIDSINDIYGGLEYNDGDIAILEDIRKLPNRSNNSLVFDMIVILICNQGHALFNLDGKVYGLSERDVMVIAPNVVIKQFEMNSDFDSVALGLSMRSIDFSLSFSKNIWKNLYYISKNPIIRLNDTEFSILSDFIHIAILSIRQGKSRPYYHEVMQGLFRSLIFEFLSITDSRDDTKMEDKSLSHCDVLSQRFVELVSLSKGRNRSVADYAEKLNVSPKYLSSAIKKATGSTPIEIIHQSTLKEIIRELRFTNKSIKEIAADFNFQSLSIFGKFVKLKLGLSPKDFRKKSQNGVINVSTNNIPFI